MLVLDSGAEKIMLANLQLMGLDLEPPIWKTKLLLFSYLV